MAKTQLMGAIIISLLAFMAGRITKESAPISMAANEDVELDTIETKESAQAPLNPADKRQDRKLSTTEEALLQMVNSDSKAPAEYKFGEVPDVVWEKESARIYSELGLDEPYDYMKSDLAIDLLLIEPNF